MGKGATLLLAAYCLAATALPGLAQDNSVRDMLNRAQSGSDKRAVEDLIKRLKSDPASPNTTSPAPSGSAATAPPAATSPAPASAAAPATGGSAQSGTTGAASAGAQSPAASAPETPAATPATPTTAGAPTLGATVGASAPAPAGTRVPPAPSSSPTTVSAPASATTPAPAALPAPQPSLSGRPASDTARAPDIAKEKNLPTVDLEVFFEYDSAAITPQATTTLVTLGQALADPQLADKRFVIAGHTDGKGAADYNLDLSQRRAEAVRQFVIEQFKLDPNNLVARGFGKQKLKNPRRPLASENRRVQIINWTSEAVGGNSR